MPDISVVTDSACDLMPEFVQATNIRVVPLTVRFGDEEFDSLSAPEFWERIQTSDEMPKTAAPSPGLFKRAFLDAAESGASGVVCVCMSSKMSATYQAAKTAAQTVVHGVKVHVIDSLSASMGLGLMVMAAADLAKAGLSLEEIVAELRELRERTRLFAVIGSLDFLKRGGRIGGAQALFGSLLSIKPIIQLNGGAVEAESRQRTRRRAIEHLASLARNAGRLERLAMASGSASDADQLEELLSSADCAGGLTVSDLGPVIGAHTGPSTIGVAFQLSR